MTHCIYADLMAQQAGPTGPKYRRIAEDLLAQIGNGEYPPGSQLPTKAELMAKYQVVETAQGAGMFVREPHAGSASPSSDTTRRLEELDAELATLRKEFSLLQAQVMNLYHSSGQAYPYGERNAEAESRAG